MEWNITNFTPCHTSKKYTLLIALYCDRSLILAVETVTYLADLIMSQIPDRNHSKNKWVNPGSKAHFIVSKEAKVSIIYIENIFPHHHSFM